MTSPPPPLPQKAILPGQHAYTFVIRILSTSLTSVSVFSVCCCSRYKSLWDKPRKDPFHMFSKSPHWPQFQPGFNSQQGPPLSGLSVSGKKNCTVAVRHYAGYMSWPLDNLIFKLFQLHNFLGNLLCFINQGKIMKMRYTVMAYL
jgi:hypothetical protein